MMSERGLKPSGLARELGISHVAVKNYLEGRIPEASQLLRMSKFFGVTMEWMLTGEKEPISIRLAEDTPEYGGRPSRAEFDALRQKINEAVEAAFSDLEKKYGLK